MCVFSTEYDFEMVVKILVFFVIICNYAEAAPTEQRARADHQPKTKFANLLQGLIKVNVDRVDTMQKIATLQDYKLRKNHISGEYYDSVETSASDSHPVSHIDVNENDEKE